MATETLGRINTPVDSVSRQIIPAMGLQAARITMMFERWLQTSTGIVTIAAKTGLMADFTYALAAHGD
jgi:hypothetical protein